MMNADSQKPYSLNTNQHQLSSHNAVSANYGGT